MSVTDRTGSTLVAVLIVTAVMTLFGITVLETASTELVMAGHYRRHLVALYAAEAGIEEARARLRGPWQGNPSFLGDRTFRKGPRWSAYLSAVPQWSADQDESYSSSATNYFPTLADPLNTRMVPNSLQSAVQYWVKIQHKTEYDAERAGHHLTSPHYLDKDGSLRRHRKRSTSQVIYYGFPPGHTGGPVQFTTRHQTAFSPVERMIAYGIAGTARALIEVEVAHPAPLPHLAAVYARGGVIFSGASAEVSGTDHCGRVAAIPAIYTSLPSTTVGTASISGIAAVPHAGTIVLDVDRVVAQLRKQSRPLAVMLGRGRALGDPFHPVVVAVSRGMRLHNLTGYGILLASENVRLVGPFLWRGSILTRGRLEIDATNGDVTIEGIVWTGALGITGPAVLRYHSCYVKQSFMGLPLQMMSWRERM